MGNSSNRDFIKENFDKVVELTDLLNKVTLPSGEVITQVKGNLEFKEVYVSSDNAVQVLEVWAKDENLSIMPCHCHSTQDEYIVMVEGTESIQYSDGKVFPLKSGEMFKIPAGTPHSATPGKGMRQIVILVPPVLEYGGSKSG